MTPNVRKIVSFGLLVIPLFLVFLGLYLWIWPVYNPLVTDTANFMTKRMSPPRRADGTRVRDPTVTPRLVNGTLVATLMN